MCSEQTALLQHAELYSVHKWLPGATVHMWNVKVASSVQYSVVASSTPVPYEHTAILASADNIALILAERRLDLQTSNSSAFELGNSFNRLSLTQQ
jgi:hypothetical protein